jgi:hypothetical protein
MGKRHDQDLLEDGRRHHFRLGCRLHDRLPCICRFWHNKTKFKVPFFETPSFKQYFLLQAKLLDLLFGTKIKLSRYCTTFEDVFRYVSFMFDVRVAQVFGALPENRAPVGVAQTNPVPAPQSQHSNFRSIILTLGNPSVFLQPGCSLSFYWGLEGAAAALSTQFTGEFQQKTQKHSPVVNLKLDDGLSAGN